MGLNFVFIRLLFYMHFFKGDPELTKFQMIGKAHDALQIFGIGRKVMKGHRCPPSHPLHRAMDVLLLDSAALGFGEDYDFASQW